MKGDQHRSTMYKGTLSSTYQRYSIDSEVDSVIAVGMFEGIVFVRGIVFGMN